jgi:hypothetical protein
VGGVARVHGVGAAGRAGRAPSDRSPRLHGRGSY